MRIWIHAPIETPLALKIQRRRRILISTLPHFILRDGLGVCIKRIRALVVLLLGLAVLVNIAIVQGVCARAGNHFADVEEEVCETGAREPDADARECAVRVAVEEHAAVVEGGIYDAVEGAAAVGGGRGDEGEGGEAVLCGLGARDRV